MIALLDTDIFIYKAGCSTERTEYIFEYNNKEVINFYKATLTEVKQHLYSKGISKKDGRLQKTIVVYPVEHAYQKIRLIIESILDSVKAEEYKSFITSADKSNFRFDLAKTKEYKGNRKDMRKPTHYEALREFVISNYNTEVVYGQEADDALGIEQTKRPDKTVICSIDKDLDMIPGYHYNNDRDELYVAHDPGTLRLDDKRKKILGTGLKWFYAQMLLGDSADNVPGIPGLGPVTVSAILEPAKTEEDMVTIVLETYKKHNCLDRFDEVVDLLWIRRQENEKRSVFINKVYRGLV